MAAMKVVMHVSLNFHNVPNHKTETRQITKWKRAKLQNENTPNHKTKLRQITKFDIIY
jgi:hypothetical protein